MDDWGVPLFLETSICTRHYLLNYIVRYYVLHLKQMLLEFSCEIIFAGGNKKPMILLIEEILHQLIGTLSRVVAGFLTYLPSTVNMASYPPGN